MIRSVFLFVIPLTQVQLGEVRHMRSAPILNSARRKVGARIAGVGLLAGLVATSVTLSGAAGAATSHKVHHPKLVVFSAEQPGLGTILTTQPGYTLYTNVGDTQENFFVASQTFAAAWPPLLVPQGDV